MTNKNNEFDAVITEALPLASHDLIESGEVPKGRLVKGANLTLRADVYGDVLSQGGLILLEGNLSGGSATNYDGNIASKGRAFNSVIEACSGKVALNYAESCLILGDSVIIKRAVNCDIVARTVHIAQSDGCSIAGKDIQIKSSATCRSKETLISILVPDSSGLNAKIKQLQLAIDEGRQIINAKEQEIALLKADVEFAKYLVLAKQIRQRTTLLNEVQRESWEKMTERFAKSMKVGSQLNAEKKLQLALVQGLMDELAQLQETKRQISAGIRCEIANVAGDTSVRCVVDPDGIASLQKNDPSIIKIRLREQDASHKRIFSSDSGSLAWRYASHDDAVTENS